MTSPSTGASGNSDSITIVSLFPTLLGTYGDGGNVLALRHRAQARGIGVDVVLVEPGDAVPRSADIYVMGGGEDTAQVAAARGLRAEGGLAAAVESGAALLAICAGYQLIGSEFPDARGVPSQGLELLDVTTTRLPQRAVGELAADPSESALAGLGDLPRMTGYENHAGATHVGPGAQPLGRVLSGVGNGDGTEGAWSGHVIGTYLHGPALARNPWIADRLLSWATGTELAPLAEREVDELRAERFRTVLGD